ncbi:hypothetical protein ABIB68_008096 [Bradyrhizobium sp. F1.2.2]
MPATQPMHNHEAITYKLSQVAAGPIRSRSAVLSIITGGGKWVEIKVQADPLYQHLLLTAEKKFWRCVQSGEPPVLFNIETPRPRLDAVKVVDMSSSNHWAELSCHLSSDARGARRA